MCWQTEDLPVITRATWHGWFRLSARMKTRYPFSQFFSPRERNASFEWETNELDVRTFTSANRVAKYNTCTVKWNVKSNASCISCACVCACACVQDDVRPWRNQTRWLAEKVNAPRIDDLNRHRNNWEKVAVKTSKQQFQDSLIDLALRVHSLVIAKENAKREKIRLQERDRLSRDLLPRSIDRSTALEGRSVLFFSSFFNQRFRRSGERMGRKNTGRNSWNTCVYDE